MKIYISRNYNKNLFMLVLYFTLFIGFFTYNFGLPSEILYVCDIVTFYLLIIEFSNVVRKIEAKVFLKMFIPLILLIMIGSLNAAFNGGSIFRWIWSLRNWGRLFVYFLLTLVFMTKKDCNKICKFTIKLYHINFIIVLGQFLFLGSLYGQDSLNGLFGRETSSVHLTITLIVITIVIAQYIAKQINWRMFICSMLEVFIIACISELRVIPVIVVLVVSIAYFATFRVNLSNILKYIVFACVGVIAVSGVSYVLRLLYPDTALNYSISEIIKAASTKGGYGYKGGIDRLTFIGVINESIFRNGNSFVGIGMGNAEYSAFALFNSNFYSVYGEKLYYLNFSSAMLYIEAGISGLILYFMSFFYVFMYFFNRTRKKLKRKQNYLGLFYEVLGCEMAIINIFFIIYNNLQRTDVGYILGFYLAIAFIGIEKES